MSYPYGQLPPGWEQQVLTGIGAPATPGNIQLLDAWEVAEQGNPARAAQYNPFDTTLSAPGATLFNTLWYDASGQPHGVENYPDWATGLGATVQTLTGSFSGIVAALRAGTATPATITGSGWGTGPFTLGEAPAPSLQQVGAPTAGGNPLSGLSSVASGAAGAVQQAGGSALGWVGKWFGKWLILIGIGLAMLLVIGALAKGGEAETIRRAVHA